MTRFFIALRLGAVDHVDEFVTVHVSESRFRKGGVVCLKDGRRGYAITIDRVCGNSIRINTVLDRDQFALVEIQPVRSQQRHICVGF